MSRQLRHLVPFGAPVRAEGYVIEHGGSLWLDKVPKSTDGNGHIHVTASSPEVFGDVPCNQYLCLRGMWRGDGIEVCSFAPAHDIRHMPFGEHAEGFSWEHYRVVDASLPASLEAEVSAVGLVTDDAGLPCLAVYTMPLVTQEWAMWAQGKPVALDPILEVEE